MQGARGRGRCSCTASEPAPRPASLKGDRSFSGDLERSAHCRIGGARRAHLGRKRSLARLRREHWLASTPPASATRVPGSERDSPFRTVCYARFPRAGDFRRCLRASCAAQHHPRRPLDAGCAKTRPSMNVRARSLGALTLVASSFASPSWAVDLPVVELGDRCTQAAAVASRLGAKPKREVGQMLESKLLLFEDSRPQGESTEILYRCSAPDGVVVGASIAISTPSEALARSAYARSKVQLQARLGPASTDTEQLTLPERIEFWTEHSRAFAAEELSAWSNAPLERASLALRKPRDAVDWQVVTVDLPPASSVGHERSGSARRWLATSLLVAVSSAAIVAALIMMPPLDRFRWLLALATPLAVAFEAYWSSGSGLAQSAQDLASRAAALCVWLLCGTLVSLLVAWLLEPRALAHSRARASSDFTRRRILPRSRRSSVGKALILAGLGLFTVLIVAMAWLFRPGQEPTQRMGELSVLAAPLGLVLATILVMRGTVAVLRERSDTAWGASLRGDALGVAGILGSSSRLLYASMWLRRLLCAFRVHRAANARTAARCPPPHA
jgi:hypothetical protein